MGRTSELITLMELARTGTIEPSGDLEAADEIMGLAFGLYFDEDGQLAHPGPINEALADHIVNDEVLRTKNMTLQEEVAIAVQSREPRLAGQIDALPTIKKPFKTYNTHELLTQALPGLRERQVGSLAVIAFRHHLPRASAQIRKAGFEAVIPDMRQTGDFDLSSGQAWIRNADSWIRRERLVIGAFAALGRL